MWQVSRPISISEATAQFSHNMTYCPCPASETFYIFHRSARKPSHNAFVQHALKDGKASKWRDNWSTNVILPQAQYRKGREEILKEPIESNQTPSLVIGLTDLPDSVQKLLKAKLVKEKAAVRKEQLSLVCINMCVVVVRVVLSVLCVGRDHLRNIV